MPSTAGPSKRLATRAWPRVARAGQRRQAAKATKFSLCLAAAADFPLPRPNSETFSTPPPAWLFLLTPTPVADSTCVQCEWCTYGRRRRSRPEPPSLSLFTFYYTTLLKGSFSTFSSERAAYNPCLRRSKLTNSSRKCQIKASFFPLQSKPLVNFARKRELQPLDPIKYRLKREREEKSERV